MGRSRLCVVRGLDPVSMFNEATKAAGLLLCAALATAAFLAGPGGAQRLSAVMSAIDARRSDSPPPSPPAASRAPAGQSSYFGEEAELDAGAGGNFHGRAELSGQEVPVVVDTGASSVVLPYEVAERIGRRPSDSDFRYPVVTANGRTFVARITLPYVRIGSVEVPDVEAAVAMPGAMADEALLGMTFLGRLRTVQVVDGRLLLRN